MELADSSERPVSRALDDRPPFGPVERLSPERLKEEQLTTLATPRRKPSLSARCLFLIMDRMYGVERTLPKFRVLELVARVPYQAWENVAYVAMTHTAREENFARRIFDKVRVSRIQQDNEQWHLLILEELVEREGTRLGFVRHRVLPQILAFFYYQLSWLLYAVRPDWSYRLNADFEDHAEHEYALMVKENPAWEETPYDGTFIEYGTYGSLAELFRQIGYDERLHKLESIAELKNPRFR